MSDAQQVVCDHHWVSSHVPGSLIFWIPQCSMCGTYNVAEINQQVRALWRRPWRVWRQQ